MALIPVLIGASGLIAGEHFVLASGSTVVLGRSRACEVSLQQSARWQAMTEEERAQCDGFNAVSRQHVRLSVSGGNARIENLSPAGTWLSGERIDGAREVVLGIEPLNIRLGPSESLNLLLVEESALAARVAKTQPLQVPREETPRSSRIDR
jgi:hypothetical protein